LRQPHSIVIDGGSRLLICDIGNQRIRSVDLATRTITTYAGTGRPADADGAPLAGTPLNGPRTFAFAPDGSLYLALRKGSAIYRIDTRRRVAPRGRHGQANIPAMAGQPLRRSWAIPGLAYAPRDRPSSWPDTETHVIRRIDIRNGVISTVLGTIRRRPRTTPLACKLSRPHGLFVDRAGLLYVTDSEAHRIPRRQDQ
jgi:sugar lactone lactonase YvrE